MLAQDQLEKLEEIVANAYSMRVDFFNRMMGRRRDIDDECDYPAITSNITAEQYKELFDREAIAAKVVSAKANETWKVQPTVYETEDVNTTTAFEEAMEDLHKSLNGGSHYNCQGKSPVWSYLHRADILCGIGHYGVLLLGIDDGKDLGLPITPRQGTKLIYLRVFPEHLAQIDAYETDPKSPRYGQPTYYSLSFLDPSFSYRGIGIPASTLRVHYSRVIHVVDDLESSEVYHRPRMQQVLNRILDLRKLYGGSAEMYWQGAFPGLSFETHPQLGGQVEVNTDAMKEMMEQYRNGLQRYLSLIGMSAKSIAPQVVDPSPQIERQIEAICIALDMPKRILMGTERGELSSAQDSNEWDARVMKRQNDHTTPRVIVPFVDRLIDIGVLPPPENGFMVAWPDLTKKKDMEKAAIAVQRTNALATYIGGDVESLVPALEFLTLILGLTEEEAKTILDKVALERDEYEDPDGEEEVDEPDEEGKPKKDKQTAGQIPNFIKRVFAKLEEEKGIKLMDDEKQRLYHEYIKKID